MRPLSQCRLYGILDTGYVSQNEIRDVAERMIGGGIDILQLRAKNWPVHEIEITVRQHLADLAAAAGVPLIINDHPVVAANCRAAGVHVGQDDLAVATAREAVGANAIVGKSTHSLDQARAAFREGADYIGFGPLFATPTKPDYTAIGLAGIAKIHEESDIPIFCIGGIKRENLARVVDAGARRVVIVSGILQADDIEGYIRDVKAILPDAS